MRKISFRQGTYIIIIGSSQTAEPAFVVQPGRPADAAFAIKPVYNLKKSPKD
jgi:hypothetical protein